MNVFTIVIGCSLCLLVSGVGEPINAPSTQLQTDTVFFDKGRTMAFLIGIVKPEAMEARGAYFNTIFPIASKYKYDLGVAFNVVEPTRGNYHPGFVAISSWPQASNRQQFLQDPALPQDLEAQRRKIWARFDQVFYQDIPNELNFVVRSDKVYLFSNFWIEDQQQFSTYLSVFKDRMKTSQGVFLASLNGGTSPKNHMYEPDAMVISEWPNAQAVNDYLAKIRKLVPDDGTKNINELVTVYVFGFGS